MSNIITTQDADAAIAAGHRETAARSQQNAQAEAQRRQVYRDQMTAAVRAQGSASQHATPGDGIKQTGDTQRHIAQEAARHERANTLSGIERITIAAAVTEQLYREAIGAGKPLPNAGTVQKFQRAAFEDAIDDKLAGAK